MVHPGRYGLSSSGGSSHLESGIEGHHPHRAEPATGDRGLKEVLNPFRFTSPSAAPVSASTLEQRKREQHADDRDDHGITTILDRDTLRDALQGILSRWSVRGSWRDGPDREEEEHRVPK